jgi:hypothetical protein
MPDQSSAADEHALMQEITAPLTTLPDDPVPMVVNVDFPIVLRGYDRLAVDAYVKKTSQLVAELQATRSPEAAVRRAIERVGEQISGILTRAHQTAAEITAQSRREAEDRLDVARQEAAQIIATSESRVRELDSDADRVWIERQRIIDDVQALSQELVALAQAAGERFPPAEEPPPAEPPTHEPPVEEPAGSEPPIDEPPADEEPADEAPVDDQPPSLRLEDTREREADEAEPTAVLPRLEGLEVEPPQTPSFGRDEPTG